MLWDTNSEDYLKATFSTDEWKRISKEFYDLWDFPNCCGASDGKHVTVQAPVSSGSSFYNYKGTFSLVLLAVCDARYRYIVDICDEGHQNDNGVFRNGDFGIALLEGKLGLPQPEKLPNSD